MEKVLVTRQLFIWTKNLVPWPSFFVAHVKEDPLYFNVKETIDDKKEINSFGTAVFYNYSRYLNDLDHHERFFSGGEFKYRMGKVKHITKLSHSSYIKEGKTYLQDNDQLTMSKIARMYVNEAGYRAEDSIAPVCSMISRAVMNF